MASPTGTGFLDPLSHDPVEYMHDGDIATVAVQYSYLRGSLDLWHVQTAYGSRPWAVEAPSAGRPLRWFILERLRRKGVRLASITHAAGLPSGSQPRPETILPSAMIGPEVCWAPRL